MAGPAFSGSNVEVEFGTATSIAFNAPARAIGDGMLVGFEIASTEPTPSTPAGWNLLLSITRSGQFKFWVYGRLAENTKTGAEAGEDNFSSSWTGSKGRFGELRKIVGGPAAVAEWLIGETNNGASVKATAKALTTASPENLAVAFYETLESATVEKTAPSSGWTKNGTWAPLYFKEQAAAESTGALEITFTSSQQWVAAQIAIPPKAEAPSSRRLATLGVGR